MISRRALTGAVQQLLATATGRPVGVGTVPLDAARTPAPPPYTLLYPLDYSTDDQMLADQHRGAVATYQTTFVSGPTPGQAASTGTVEQAEWLADRARTAVLDRAVGGATGYAQPLTVPGAVCYRREATEVGATSDPNDGIITYVIRFRFYLDAA
ncbi:hypothetical protein ACFV3R_25375 [Streptomyces sp. NPDC059740]|uniref:hypothetical protein n=1 Tax=Streptomyces sp. NPDC059740 TaxID=3346926 RepID=UPI003655ECBB